MIMSCYLTLPCKCHYPGCQCPFFKGARTHNRMTCVNYYHAIVDHYEGDLMNAENNLQTSAPITHPTNYDVSNVNNSLQRASPPIANLECNDLRNSTASHALLSEITHPNDNGSTTYKTFATPEHDVNVLPQIKDCTSKLVKLAPPNENKNMLTYLALCKCFNNLEWFIKRFVVILKRTQCTKPKTRVELPSNRVLFFQTKAMT